jgi:hypothetical protein
MTRDLQEEVAIVARVGQFGRWRTAQRDAAQNERPGVESKILFASATLFKDQLDRVELF